MMRYAHHMKDVAFEYFGWRVVIDDSLPDDAYIVEPSPDRTIRMREDVWWVVSNDGLIEDIIDTLDPDVGGLVFALCERYEKAKAEELATRPNTLRKDRIQDVLRLSEDVVQQAASGVDNAILMAKVRDVRSQLSALREELEVAEAQLELAERVILPALV